MGPSGSKVTLRNDLWDDFLRSSRGDVGYKQSSWWADFLATRGWQNFGVVVREADLIVGGAKVLVDSFAPGKCFYYVPHGPVLPDDRDDAAQVFQALMSYIDEDRMRDSRLVSHLRLEPRWIERPEFVRGFRESSTWLEPRRTLCIDLSLTEAEILAQMKPKGRYNIKVARKNGVAIVEDTSPRGLEDFLELYDQTFQRHDIRRHSTQYFRLLFERLMAFDCGAIFFAEYQGSRLATALVLYFGDTATYKYGGSLNAHRNVMAPYLLQFEIMRQAKTRGHRWYDFYGVAPPDTPDDPWANFSDFKRKFGGCEHCFVPALDYVYDSTAYDEYRHRRK